MKAARISSTTWMRGGAIAVVLSFASSVQAQAATAVAPSPRTHSTQINGRAEAHRNISPLDRRVSLDLQNVRLEAALEAIDKQAKLELSYTARLVPLDRRVSIRVDSVTAKLALEQLLQGTGLRAVMTKSGTVILERYPERSRSETVADSGVVYGQVRDSATGRALEGAVVSVEGTSIRFVTAGASGAYYIKVPAGVHTLTVRMLGYMKATHEVVVVGKQNVRADFALRMGMSRLQEMVTTATGKRRRVEVANDITVIRVDSVLATAPVNSVTDLLETRVPGLTVQHTSGAPGDPSRLRLRGASSIYASNDPIIIVDGVRVYGAQSDGRGGNLTSTNTNARTPSSIRSRAYAAPSPLDQIDPQSIETIEVVKGPSAATLYGADAANGVIVITTKKGRSGPAHWRISAAHGLSYMPGRYPDAYLRLGHDYNGAMLFCTLGSYCGAGADSLVRFQALNAPDLTVLDHGRSTRVSLGVDGGSSGLSYSFTGSVDDEIGLLKLPEYEATRFQQIHGTAPPEWMRRPQSLSRWNGTGRVTAQLGRTADVSVTSTLMRETQQRSSLETQLSALMSTYIDRTSGTYYQISGNRFAQTTALVPDFYERVTDKATNFTNAATLTWRPRTWLTGSANAGVNVISRNDEILLPRDMLDTLGGLRTAHGSSIVSTVNLRALATAPLPWGFHFQFTAGANYTKTAIGDLSTSVEGLAEGTTGLNGAGQANPPSQTVREVTNAGWYVEPSFAHKRFFLSAGLRFDGGNTYGTHVKLPTFPKLGGSWLISDEPWFPFKSVFNTLRLRAAYGHAGVQPGISDRLRLYGSSNPYSFVNGGNAQAYGIQNLGNTKLRPERSTEIEGGFDADLLSDRVSVSFSGYRKVRKDALIQVPVAPSVYGHNVRIWKNIGVIRNTGVEATVTARAVRSDLLTWSWTLGVSHNKNLVVALARGVDPFNIGNGQRVAPGYPLFGRWARPILGYADADQDGVIEANEVQLGDSLVFMGETMPNYEVSSYTSFSLLRGVITVNAGFDYQNGLTQINQTARENRSLSRAANDPTAEFSRQAAVAVMGETDYGLVQTVNTLRFNSLSVAFNAPPSLARRFGTRALTIALQGSNVGLFTNYHGKDPNVNAYAAGNLVADTGVLPQPRSWQLVVSARF